METNPGTSQALGQDLSLIFMLRPGQLPRIAMLVLRKRPKPQFSSFVSACTLLCDLDNLLNLTVFQKGDCVIILLVPPQSIPLHHLVLGHLSSYLFHSF